ncbi:MAG: protein kinase [Archangium sp.]
MAGVMCPKCGTVSSTDTRACPKCGTALGLGNDSTSKSKAFKPGAAKAAAPARRPAANDPGMATAPDDTMMEHEDKPAPPPPARKPVASQGAARPAGPVPQGNGAPRASKNTRANSGEGSSATKSDSLIGRNLQEYIIESRLGVGGMGVVYKATHKMIGKSVAIKVLRADIVQDPRDMDRLLDEARIISAIKNRGIINIFGAGTLEDGRHYLIMEMLEGEALEQLMQREGKVNAGDAVVILEQVLSALSAAHEAGVVHRDLKPANVFLVKEGNLFYVKLLDFGLARRSQQNVTRIAGTPDYISPEHARGRPAGPPADLYAFGILCFHMLTGQLPFIGTTPMEVMEKHVHHPPPVPHEINKEIPKALSELILKLLAKEPGERPDAAQVKADLRAATKQMRNASTMMSLMQIDPVVSESSASKKAGAKGAAPAPESDDKKRARELAVSAQVADLKRKVTRRWPWVLGGVVGVWLVAVLAYAMWPTPTEVPQPPISKKPPKNPKNGTDPTGNLPPKNPKNTDDPVALNPVNTDTPKNPNNDTPTNPVGVQPENPSAEVDAGAEEVVIDENAVLGDNEVAALKDKARIDQDLGEVKAALRDNSKLRKLFETLHKDVEATCAAVQTLKQFRECEDQKNDLYESYRRQL